jgi:Recombination endonuclease VII
VTYSKKEYDAEYRAANPEKVAANKKRHYEANRDMYAKRKRKWQDKNKDRRFAIDLERKYHLTLEQYQEMLERQGGRCAVCSRTPEDNSRRFAVDHDHACCPGNSSCGKCVRSLLCNVHNLILGQLHDDLITLQRIATYVELWAEQRTNSVSGTL